MKTQDDLAVIEAQLLKIDEEFFGTKETPKKRNYTHDEINAYFKKHQQLCEELREPVWKEAGIEEDAKRVLERFSGRFNSKVTCPSCKSILTTEIYSHTLSFLENAFGSIGATFKALNSKKQVLRNITLSGREAAGFFTGNDYRSEDLRVCTNCKCYFTECPYCSSQNLMNGKISCEGEEMKCKNCDREYAVYIFHNR